MQTLVSKVIYSCKWVIPVHSGPTSNGQSDNTRSQECRLVSGSDGDIPEALCLEVKVKDQDYVCFLLKGIEEGFRIGVDPDRVFKCAKRNMLSAEQNSKVIKDYIDSEVGSGNIVGPFSPVTAPKVHINRFGAITKRHQPGKCRLITDLSYPEGSSVNDAIDPAQPRLYHWVKGL